MNDIHKEHGAEAVKELVQNPRKPEDVPGEKPDQPLPLIRELPPADPFPVAALGGILQRAAEAIRDKVQCPIAICGQSVLAVATLAAQSHVNVALPMGHSKPCSNFFVTVAETGERKSACDTEAAWPIIKREAFLREQYAVDIVGYENSRTAWEASKKAIEHRNKKNPSEMKHALDALGTPPRPPLEPLLICPEPTFEGLSRYLAGGQPSVGIFSAEGGQFIGGHGMSHEKKLMTAAGLSTLWDGAPLRRVRAGDGATILAGRRCSAHLMAQSKVAAIMLGDDLLMNQGLLSRLCVTAPDSTAGTRFWRDPSPQSDLHLKAYGARILSILESPLPLAQGKENELEPRVLLLSGAARQGWIDYANHIESRISAGGALEPIRGLANKLPEIAARLAAVLCVVNDLSAADIDGAYMEAGISLADHYAAEALRLFGVTRINPDLLLAQKLLNWLHTSWTEDLISLPVIYQSSLNAIGDSSTALRIVSTLENNGWLRKTKGKHTVAGVMRRDVWSIVKPEATP